MISHSGKQSFLPWEETFPAVGNASIENPLKFPTLGNFNGKYLGNTPISFDNHQGNI